jgi:hypothetical protein
MQFDMRENGEQLHSNRTGQRETSATGGNPTLACDDAEKFFEARHKTIPRTEFYISPESDPPH